MSFIMRATAKISPKSNAQAVEEVWSQLGKVTDPELDEALPDLGFIQKVEVNSNYEVYVAFRLPTYWCAANFAFMMAQDIRERIEELGWPNRANVELLDHFCADEINLGNARGDSFAASFPTEASGNLDDLRRLFAAKAFMRRQECLLRYLFANGFSAPEVVNITISELTVLALADEAAARIRDRYLDVRRPMGDSSPSAPAFVKPNGERLTPDVLQDYLTELRRTSANIDFNVAMCSSLLRARSAR